MSRTEVDAEPGSQPPPEDDHAFLGRPQGSTDTLASSGMSMPAGTAACVSAASGTRVHLVSAAGDRLGDRALGSYHAVLWGGTMVSVIAPVAYFAVMFTNARVTREERGRLRPYAVLFLAHTAFGFILSGHASDDCLVFACWIVGPYLLLGLGGILLEASGMRATTRLAPAAFASRTMPPPLLSLAPANGIQAQSVNVHDDFSERARCGVIGATAVAAGLAVIATGPWRRRTMPPVH